MQLSCLAALYGGGRRIIEIHCGTRHEVQDQEDAENADHCILPNQLFFRGVSSKFQRSLVTLSNRIGVKIIICSGIAIF